MLGNTAPSQIADPAQSVSLRVVLSAQAVGELSALSHPAETGHVVHRELAGILFGVVLDNSVIVETVRQLPAENGPIFAGFSAREFDEIVRSSRADHTLDSFQIIGWYRFHTGGELQLDPVETEFHQNFFQKPDQLGLLVRPEAGAALSILACSRSQDGAFSRTQHCSASIVVNTRRVVRQTVDLRAGPTFGEEAYIQAYRILDGNGPPTKRNWLLWAALAVALVAVVAIYLKVTSEPAAAPATESRIQPLSLTLTGEGANLLVSWIGGVSAPRSAKLKIYDGDSISELDITKSYAPSGSVTVPRRSGNVHAVISVTDGEHRWQSESSLVDDKFRATQQAHADLAAVAKTSEDQSTLNALRQENQRLQQMVNTLQQQEELAPYKPHRKKKK